MATLQDFQTALDRVNAATTTIAERIRTLEESISNMGLTAEQEQQIHTQLTGIADGLEQMAQTPENPVPVDPNTPTEQPATDANQPTPTPQP